MALAGVLLRNHPQPSTISRPCPLAVPPYDRDCERDWRGPSFGSNRTSLGRKNTGNMIRPDSLARPPVKRRTPRVQDSLRRRTPSLLVLLRLEPEMRKAKNEVFWISRKWRSRQLLRYPLEDREAVPLSDGDFSTLLRHLCSGIRHLPSPKLVIA